VGWTLVDLLFRVDSLECHLVVPFKMKNVLIIDDDSVLRIALAQWFKSDGWQVLEADNGEEGLALALHHRPAMVVCDLLMPRCNGYQVIRALRAEPGELGKTKIIVTSASSFATDRLNALECGADDYLVKPLNRSQFLKIVRGMSDPETVRQGLTTVPEPVMDGSRCTIKFWGVRGSIPTPGPGTVYYGGNTSCVEFRGDGEIIILDAGTGLRCLGNELAVEFKGRPLEMTLLLTHTHWDHIHGFPFFAPAYDSNNKLRVLAFQGVQKDLESTLSTQMESPFFPISMGQLPGNITVQEIKDMTFHIGKVKVHAAFMNHPGVCVGYRLVSSHGSIAYLPDHELFQRLKALGRSQPTDDFPAVEEFARHQDQKLVEFLKGVDVLISDSQYDETEYLSRIGWGHSCADDSLALAVAAEAKVLYMFHHDPGHDDEKISRMVCRARDLARHLGSSLRVEAAREGLQVELPLAASPAADKLGGQHGGRQNKEG
jgi:phosphoribosyl 1,2-cyclic phosphodiesterase/ActR/RegA family two-component response regulator